MPERDYPGDDDAADKDRRIFPLLGGFTFAAFHFLPFLQGNVPALVPDVATVLPFDFLKGVTHG